MAVISVTEEWSGHGGEGDAENGFRRRRTWVVDCSSPNDDATVAENAPGIPSLRAPYAKGGTILLNTRVVSKRAESIGPLSYRVIVDYGTTNNGQGVDRSVHPLDRPWKIRGTFIQDEQPIDEAFDESDSVVPIVTTNGEGFDPPLTETLNDQRLIITRNEASINLNAHYAYNDALNNAPFFGHPRGTAKMAPIESESMEEVFDDVLVKYFSVTYTIDFRRPRGGQNPERVWYRRILNQGFIVRVQDVNGGEAFDIGNPPEEILSELKEKDISAPRTSPCRIDSAGYLITDDAAHWLEFRRYPFKDFSVWGLE